MFSTESEQTTEHPCVFPHPTASCEGQTNAIFPAHSQTKCRAGKQLHIKDGGKLQNPQNDLICVFLCVLTAVSFCYNGIFIVMICVCARLCCSTSKLVSLQLLAFDSFQCYYFRNKAFIYEHSLIFVFVHIQFSKQQIINAYCIHANFSKSPWGILRVATFRRTKNLRRFVVMLDYCTIF